VNVDEKITIALIVEPPIESIPEVREGVYEDDPRVERIKEPDPVPEGIRERVGEPTDAELVLNALGNIEPAELTVIDVAFDGRGVGGAHEDAVSEAGMSLAPMDWFGVEAWKVNVGVTAEPPVPAGIGKTEASFETNVDWKGVLDVLDPTDGDSAMLELPLEAASVAAEGTIADGIGVIDALAPLNCELISMEVPLAATVEPAGAPGKIKLNVTEETDDSIGARIPLGLAVWPMVMGGGCEDANGVTEFEAELDDEALIP